MSRTAPLLAFVCSAIWLSPAWGDPAGDLLKYVPQEANSIAVLRVQQLMNSPRGIAEGWAERHASGYLDGSITVPPWVDFLLRGSHYQPGSMQSDWAVALLPLPAGFDIAQLATREGTEVQEISGHPAVFSPARNGYFVEVNTADEQRILAGQSPATRQQVARWVAGFPEDRRPHVSRYLTEAVEDEAAQLLLAIDLHELLDPVQIRYRLSGAEALQSRQQARTALTIAFQTLRGAQLAVHVQETANATIRIDFARTIGNEGQFIKPLLIEFLADAGAMLDELDEATVQVQGNSVILRMPLSDESLRRILSLVTTPPTASDPAAREQLPTPPPVTETPSLADSRVDVNASLRYYRAVNQYIDDLNRAYRRAKNYGQTAQWHENFARKIESLPATGVDSEIVEYGEQIGSYFRALAASLRGTGVNIDALNRTIVYQVEQTPVYRSGIEWWWGGAWTTTGRYTYGQPVQTKIHTNLQEVRAQQGKIVAEATQQRQQIWELITTTRTEKQTSLVKKYGEEFRK